MKLNKKLIIVMVVVITATMTFNVRAQQTEPVALDNALKNEIVDSVTTQYSDWETISLSGKLSSPMLPVTTSVKIYMVKGEIVILTISAPLVGEAARIEMDKDKVLIVNKMKSAYSSIEMAELEPLCPGGLDALQNLLLGRITIMGQGILNKGNAEDVEVYEADEDSWLILPDQDIENAPYVYFYTIDKSDYLLERFAVLAQSGEGEANCYYTWETKNMTINMSTLINGTYLEASLRLNNPDTKTKVLERLELSGKYKQTDIKGLLM